MSKKPLERHVFVCINQRAEGASREDCASKGAVDLHAQLKAMSKAAGLSSRVRVNKAGCLDACECGVAMVVYPDAVWYGRCELGDLQEIVDSHLLGGVPVERLRLKR